MTSTVFSGKYQVLIKEEISGKSLAWFEEFNIARTTSGTTMLTGWLPDQSALHGLLAKIRDLNFTLISVNPIEDEVG